MLQAVVAWVAFALQPSAAAALTPAHLLPSPSALHWESSAAASCATAALLLPSSSSMAAAAAVATAIHAQIAQRQRAAGSLGRHYHSERWKFPHGRIHVSKILPTTGGGK